ncbi:hypothetical protein WA158_004695 [Blastocystis sp. Blastoise]
MRPSKLTIREKRSNKKSHKHIQNGSTRIDTISNDNEILQIDDILFTETCQISEDSYINCLLNSIEQKQNNDEVQNDSKNKRFFIRLMNLIHENSMTESQIENMILFLKECQEDGIINLNNITLEENGKKIATLFICQKCQKVIQFDIGHLEPRLSKEYNKCLCGTDSTIQKVIMYPLCYRIISLLSDEKQMQELSFIKSTEILSYLETKRIPNNHHINPLFYSELFSSYVSPILKTCDYVFTFTMSVDGVALYNHSKNPENKSTTPISLLLLNNSLEQCLDSKSHYFYSVTQSAINEVIMEYLLKEFKYLYENGIKFYDKNQNKYVTAKAILLCSCCDFPEAAKQIHMNNQVGSFFCRYCKVRKEARTKNGIKTCFSSVNSDKRSFMVNKSLPIMYSCSKEEKKLSKESLSSNIKIILDKPITIKKEYVQPDFFDSIDIEIRNEIDIKKDRNIGSFGLSPVESLYEKYLSYYSIFNSMPLDWMHLYGNICDTLIQILFHHKKVVDNKIIMDSLVKFYKIKSGLTKQEIYNSIPLFLNENILSTMYNIIGKINRIKKSPIGSYSYMINEIDYYSSSIYNRIFFFCKVIPLLLEGYSENDCLLIPVVFFLASFINKTLTIRTEYTQEEINILKMEATKIVLYLEVTLPSILFNTQLHSLLHIPQNIQNLGSLRLYSTSSYERSYSMMRRFLLNRRYTCTSLMNKLILSEFAYQHKSVTNLTKRNQNNKNANFSLEWKYNLHKTMVISEDDIKVIYGFCLENQIMNLPFCNNDFNINTKEKSNLLIRKQIFMMLKNVYNTNVFIESSFKPEVMKIDCSFLCFYEKGNIRSSEAISVLQVQEIIKVCDSLFIIGKHFKNFMFSCNKLYGVITNPNDFELDYVIPIEWVIQSNLLVVDDAVYIPLCTRTRPFKISRGTAKIMENRVEWNQSDNQQEDIPPSRDQKQLLLNHVTFLLLSSSKNSQQPQSSNSLDNYTLPYLNMNNLHGNEENNDISLYQFNTFYHARQFYIYTWLSQKHTWVKKQELVPRLFKKHKMPLPSLPSLSSLTLSILFLSPLFTSLPLYLNKLVECSQSHGIRTQAAIYTAITTIIEYNPQVIRYKPVLDILCKGMKSRSIMIQEKTLHVLYTCSKKDLKYISLYLTILQSAI